MLNLNAAQQLNQQSLVYEKHFPKNHSPHFYFRNHLLKFIRSDSKS